MAEPISEQIVQRIVSRLQLIKRTSGYAVDVEVYRLDETGEPSSPANKDIAITVAAMAPIFDEKLSYCGRDAYNMQVAIMVNCRRSKDSPLAVDALHARVLSDVHKVLGSDPNCNSLAADMTRGKAAQGLEERMPAADAVYDVFFFTTRNDPTQL